MTNTLQIVRELNMLINFMIDSYLNKQNVSNLDNLRYTVTEVSDVLSVSDYTVRKLIRNKIFTDIIVEKINGRSHKSSMLILREQVVELAKKDRSTWLKEFKIRKA